MNAFPVQIACIMHNAIFNVHYALCMIKLIIIITNFSHKNNMPQGNIFIGFCYTLCIMHYTLCIMHYALYIYSIHNALCIFKFITVLDNFSQRKWHPTRHKLRLFCMHLCVCMHFSLCIMHYASCNIYCDICITEFITIIDRISHLKWHPTRPNLYWFFIPWIIHYALCIMHHASCN